MVKIDLVTVSLRSRAVLVGREAREFRGYAAPAPCSTKPPCYAGYVTVFDAILTSRQTREKLQCFYENLMSNNFRRMAVLKKI